MDKSESGDGRTPPDPSAADSVRATVVPWSHGWELHVWGLGVTQAGRLDEVERQVRDFCEVMDAPVGDRAIWLCLDGGHGEAPTR